VKGSIIKVKVAEVIFREDLYPRLEKSAATVQKYAEDLSVLPLIEINQDKILIDGWNRWMAHKQVGAEFIYAFVTETKNAGEILVSRPI
jgi:hypothetical protein